MKIKFSLNKELMRKWVTVKLKVKIFVLFYNEIKKLNFYGTEFFDKELG